jgi:hypothetical protein
MAPSHRNPVYVTHTAIKRLITFTNGPWIPQTPDSYKDPDFDEKWQEEEVEEE